MAHSMGANLQTPMCSSRISAEKNNAIKKTKTTLKKCLTSFTAYDLAHN